MTKLSYDDYKATKLSHPHYAEEYDTPKKLENAIKKDYGKYSDLYNKPLVKKIVINIPYKNSRTWGRVVTNGTAEITYVNGETEYVTGLKASGYGYDKGQSILMNVMNKYARQNLLDYEPLLKDEYASKGRGGWDGQDLAGISVDGFGQLRYGFGGTRGQYFNFDITENVLSDSFDQYVVTFKNGATNKMYARKVTAPRKKRASPAKKCPVRVDFRKML